MVILLQINFNLDRKMKSHSMMKFISILVGLAINFPAIADDVLPKELKGTISRPPRYHFSWSIVVESQETDGAVKGKFNFEGHNCHLDGLAFTGTYHEGNLQLNVPAASPDCGPWDIKLKRTDAAGFKFEGSSREAANPSATTYLKGG